MIGVKDDDVALMLVSPKIKVSVTRGAKLGVVSDYSSFHIYFVRSYRT